MNWEDNKGLFKGGKMAPKTLALFIIAIIVLALVASLLFFTKPAHYSPAWHIIYLCGEEESHPTLTITHMKEQRLLPQMGNQGNFPKGYMYPKGLM